MPDHKYYPDPEIPADAAWKDMNARLDHATDKLAISRKRIIALPFLFAYLLLLPINREEVRTLKSDTGKSIQAVQHSGNIKVLPDHSTNRITRKLSQRQKRKIAATENNVVQKMLVAAIPGKSVAFPGKAAIMYQPIGNGADSISPHQQPYQKRISNKQEAASTPAVARKIYHNKVPVSAGLTWNIGLKHPDRFYLPGIWTAIRLNDKNELVLQVHPWQSQSFGTLLKDTILMANFNQDTRGYRHSTSLEKTRQFSVGLQYNYRIYGNWKVGIGVTWNSIRSSGLRKKIVQLSNNKQLLDSTYSIRSGAAEWNLLQQEFFTVNAGLSYKWRNFEIGGRLVSGSNGMIKNNLINTQISIKWKIY